jgi:hypothetical protein
MKFDSFTMDREPLYVSSSIVLLTEPELKGNVSTPTGGAPVLNQTPFCVAASTAFSNLRARLISVMWMRKTGRAQLCPLRRSRGVDVREHRERLDVLACRVRSERRVRRVDVARDSAVPECAGVNDKPCLRVEHNSRQELPGRDGGRRVCVV